MRRSHIEISLRHGVSASGCRTRRGELGSSALFANDAVAGRRLIMADWAAKINLLTQAVARTFGRSVTATAPVKPVPLAPAVVDKAVDLRQSVRIKP
jgi:hypothetical protein